jgi:hypothetical protein
LIQHDQSGSRMNHTLRHRRAYEAEPTRNGNARAAEIKEEAGRQIQHFDDQIRFS